MTWALALACSEPTWLDDSCFSSSLQLKQSEWDAFWGWDLVAPGGLLERIYDHLALPGIKWEGLKRLPLVGNGGRVPLGVIKGFVHVIDDQVAASLPAAASQPAPQQWRQHQPSANEPSSSVDGPAAGLVRPMPQVGYLPSIDDMLLQGTPLPEAAAGSPSAAATSPTGGTEADTGGGSSAEGTPTAATQRPVQEALFKSWFSESDDEDWEEDMRREQLAAAAVSGHCSWVVCPLCRW